MKLKLDPEERALAGIRDESSTAAQHNPKDTAADEHEPGSGCDDIRRHSESSGGDSAG